MTRRTVLVVGAEENPVLPILESLSRAGLDVSVASHRRMCLGFFSRYAKGRFLYPSPYARREEFLEALLGIVKANHFDVTLVIGDQTTDLLAEHKNSFLPYTRIPLVDLDRFQLCRDKSQTMKIAESLRVPIPKTYYPDTCGIEELSRSVQYPVVLKPNCSDGARGISYPKTPEELIALYYTTVQTYGACHVQEYIPQTGMQYKAEFVLDYSGAVQGWCVYNKIRYFPVTGGSSTLNSTVQRPDILEKGYKILKEMKWYGMADCDFIEDPRDGVVKLMEINPRFTRSIKICVKAGVDFPLQLYKLAMGEPMSPMLDYSVGLYQRYLPGDILWFLRSPQRFRSNPSFFKFMGENMTDEIFSLTDPLPSLGYLLSKGSNLISKNERQYCFRRL